LGAIASPGLAQTFDAQRLDERNFILVASPYGVNQRNYQLLILEQYRLTRPCWQEYGSNPTRVNPLLLGFDFTNICKRMTDSNGYSLRIGNQDLGWRFLLSIVERNNELVLIANSSRERNVEIEIGRTNGIADEYLKIELDPGWSLTRRTYNGRGLDHVYVTGDPNVVQVPAGAPMPIDNTPTPTGSPLPPVDREIIITPVPPSDRTPLPAPLPSPSPRNDSPLPPLPPPPPERRIPSL
jgi:N-acetylmuramoyl-L-alanine amidase